MMAPQASAGVHRVSAGTSDSGPHLLTVEIGQRGAAAQNEGVAQGACLVRAAFQSKPRPPVNSVEPNRTSWPVTVWHRGCATVRQ